MVKKKADEVRKWYLKLSTPNWLRGRIRYEDSPYERDVFTALMCVASENNPRGYISWGKEAVPLPTLAQQLNYKMDEFMPAFENLAKRGRVELLPNGVVFLPNFQFYQDSTKGEPELNGVDSKSIIDLTQKQKGGHYLEDFERTNATVR